MRIHGATLLIALLVSTSAFAEDPDPKAVHATHDRIEKAIDAADFNAWKAEMHPDLLAEREHLFDQQKGLIELEPEPAKAFAAEAGVTLEELAKLTWEQYMVAWFKFLRGPRIGDLFVRGFLATCMSGPGGQEDSAQVQVLDASGMIWSEHYIRVAGQWKFRQLLGYRTTVGSPTDPKEACELWRSAVLEANGANLLATYPPEYKLTYLRGWGKHLGTIQESGREALEKAAAELGVKAEEFWSMGVERYALLRLDASLKTWLAQNPGARKLKIHFQGLNRLGGDEASCTIQGVDARPLLVKRDGGWVITSDCFDEQREELKK